MSTPLAGQGQHEGPAGDHERPFAASQGCVHLSERQGQHEALPSDAQAVALLPSHLSGESGTPEQRTLPARRANRRSSARAAGQSRRRQSQGGRRKRKAQRGESPEREDLCGQAVRLPQHGGEKCGRQYEPHFWHSLPAEQDLSGCAEVRPGVPHADVPAGRPATPLRVPLPNASLDPSGEAALHETQAADCMLVLASSAQSASVPGVRESVPATPQPAVYSGEPASREAVAQAAVRFQPAPPAALHPRGQDGPLGRRSDLSARRGSLGRRGGISTEGLDRGAIDNGSATERLPFKAAPHLDSGVERWQFAAIPSTTAGTCRQESRAESTASGSGCRKGESQGTDDDDEIFVKPDARLDHQGAERSRACRDTRSGARQAAAAPPAQSPGPKNAAAAAAATQGKAPDSQLARHRGAGEARSLGPPSGSAATNTSAPRNEKGRSVGPEPGSDGCFTTALAPSCPQYTGTTAEEGISAEVQPALDATEGDVNSTCLAWQQRNYCGKGRQRFGSSAEEEEGRLGRPGCEGTSRKETKKRLSANDRTGEICSVARCRRSQRQRGGVEESECHQGKRQITNCILGAAATKRVKTSADRWSKKTLIDVPQHRGIIESKSYPNLSSNHVIFGDRRFIDAPQFVPTQRESKTDSFIKHSDSIEWKILFETTIPCHTSVKPSLPGVCEIEDAYKLVQNTTKSATRIANHKHADQSLTIIEDITGEKTSLSEKMFPLLSSSCTRPEKPLSPKYTESASCSALTKFVNVTLKSVPDHSCRLLENSLSGQNTSDSLTKDESSLIYSTENHAHLPVDVKEDNVINRSFSSPESLKLINTFISESPSNETDRTCQTFSETKQNTEIRRHDIQPHSGNRRKQKTPRQIIYKYHPVKENKDKPNKISSPKRTIDSYAQTEEYSLTLQPYKDFSYNSLMILPEEKTETVFPNQIPCYQKAINETSRIPPLKYTQRRLYMQPISGKVFSSENTKTAPTKTQESQQKEINKRSLKQLLLNDAVDENSKDPFVVTAHPLLQSTNVARLKTGISSEVFQPHVGKYSEVSPERARHSRQCSKRSLIKDCNKREMKSSVTRSEGMSVLPAFQPMTSRYFNTVGGGYSELIKPSAEPEMVSAVLLDDKKEVADKKPTNEDFSVLLQNLVKRVGEDNAVSCSKEKPYARILKATKKDGTFDKLQPGINLRSRSHSFNDTTDQKKIFFLLRNQTKPGLSTFSLTENKFDSGLTEIKSSTLGINTTVSETNFTMDILKSEKRALNLPFLGENLSNTKNMHTTHELVRYSNLLVPLDRDSGSLAIQLPASNESSTRSFQTLAELKSESIKDEYNARTRDSLDTTTATLPTSSSQIPLPTSVPLVGLPYFQIPLVHSGALAAFMSLGSQSSVSGYEQAGHIVPLIENVMLPAYPTPLLMAKHVLPDPEFPQPVSQPVCLTNNLTVAASISNNNGSEQNMVPSQPHIPSLHQQNVLSGLSTTLKRDELLLNDHTSDQLQSRQAEKEKTDKALSESTSLLNTDLPGSRDLAATVLPTDAESPQGRECANSALSFKSPQTPQSHYTERPDMPLLSAPSALCRGATFRTFPGLVSSSTSSAITSTLTSATAVSSPSVDTLTTASIGGSTVHSLATAAQSEKLNLLYNKANENDKNEMNLKHESSTAESTLDRYIVDLKSNKGNDNAYVTAENLDRRRDYDKTEEPDKQDGKELKPGLVSIHSYKATGCSNVFSVDENRGVISEDTGAISLHPNSQVQTVASSEIAPQTIKNKEKMFLPEKKTLLTACRPLQPVYNTDSSSVPQLSMKENQNFQMKIVTGAEKLLEETCSMDVTSVRQSATTSSKALNDSLTRRNDTMLTLANRSVTNYEKVPQTKDCQSLNIDQKANSGTPEGMMQSGTSCNETTQVASGTEPQSRSPAVVSRARRNRICTSRYLQDTAFNLSDASDASDITPVTSDEEWTPEKHCTEESTISSEDETEQRVCVSRRGGHFDALFQHDKRKQSNGQPHNEKRVTGSTPREINMSSPGSQKLVSCARETKTSHMDATTADVPTSLLLNNPSPATTDADETATTWQARGSTDEVPAGEASKSSSLPKKERRRRHYTKEDLTCHTCGKYFQNFYRLKRHELAHGDLRPFLCDVCGKAFKQAGHRNEHQLIHSIRRRSFLCNICGVVIASRSSFRYHLQHHHKQLQPGMISTSQYQIVHEPEKTGSRGPAAGPASGAASAAARPRAVGRGRKRRQRRDRSCKKASPADQLSRAVNQSEEVAVRFHEAVSETPHAIYDCPHCPSRFSSAQSLNCHLETHDDVLGRCHVQPYTCTDCGRSYTYRHNLDLHRQVHLQRKTRKLNRAELYLKKVQQAIAEGKPHFDCDTCGKVYLRKETLVKHTKIHLGLRPHQCPYCHRQFSQKIHLTVHCRLHTGSRPFQCRTCRCCFLDSTALARHVTRGVCFKEGFSYDVGKRGRKPLCFDSEAPHSPETGCHAEDEKDGAASRLAEDNDAQPTLSTDTTETLQEQN